MLKTIQKFLRVPFLVPTVTDWSQSNSVNLYSFVIFLTQGVYDILVLKCY